VVWGARQDGPAIRASDRVLGMSGGRLDAA